MANLQGAMLFVDLVLEHDQLSKNSCADQMLRFWRDFGEISSSSLVLRYFSQGCELAVHMIQGSHKDCIHLNLYITNSGHCRMLTGKISTPSPILQALLRATVAEWRCPLLLYREVSSRAIQRIFKLL